MGQFKIFIPDDLETQIKATGKPIDEVILDLIRDRFQIEAKIMPKEKLNLKAQCTEIERSLAKESTAFSSKISEYEAKNSLEGIKILETSIEDMMRVHKETERLISELRRTVDATKKAARYGNNIINHITKVEDNSWKSKG